MNRKILVSVITVLTGLYLYTSCTKIDTTDLGNDLIPAVDNVHTFDTVLDVIADNKLLNDTTVTYGRQPVAIGEIANDPEFGKTEASVYFSMGPSFFGTNPFPVQDSIQIDSVVLSLTYSTLWGDSLSVQDFEVREIDPAANFKDSNYRVESPALPVLPTLLGSKTVNFQQLNDSVYYVNGNDTIGNINELRIKLDTTFGRRFVNYDTAAEYKTDSAFRANFKGLVISVNEATSAAMRGLAYFNLSGEATKITFYCRSTKDGKTDTIGPSFAFTGRQANYIYRTPANGFLTYLNNATPDDDLVYIQSSPGSYAEIKIPGLTGLDNRVIHRAELILEKIPSAEENLYTPPNLLFIDAINDAGDSTFTIRNDFQYTGQGLGYDLSVLRGDLQNNSRYVFNISRYVQSIVTHKMRSHTLRVYAPFVTDPFFEAPNGTAAILPTLLFINNPIASGRVIVGGGSHPTQRMRLRIIYSKL